MCYSSKNYRCDTFTLNRSITGEGWVRTILTQLTLWCEAQILTSQMGARKRHPRGRDWTSIREAGCEARKPRAQSGRSLTCAATTKCSLTREGIEGMTDPPLWNTSLGGLKSLTKMVRCLLARATSPVKQEGALESSSSHHSSTRRRMHDLRQQEHKVGTWEPCMYSREWSMKRVGSNQCHAGDDGLRSQRLG